MKKFTVVLMMMLITLAAVYADTTSKEVQITYVVGTFFNADFQIWYDGVDATDRSVRMDNTATTGIAAGKSGKFSLMDMTQINMNGTNKMTLAVSLVNDHWTSGSVVSKSILSIDDGDFKAVENAGAKKVNNQTAVVVTYKAPTDRSCTPTEVANFVVSWSEDTTAAALSYSATISVACTTN